MEEALLKGRVPERKKKKDQSCQKGQKVSRKTKEGKGRKPVRGVRREKKLKDLVQ